MLRATEGRWTWRAKLASAMVTNMIVDLLDADFSNAGDDEVQRRLGVSLEHKRGLNEEERTWVARNFGGRWHEEAAAGWNWFAYDSERRPVGFATYEQRELKWWWLEGWWNNPDVGLFGPTGVQRRLRGKSLGCILTRRALASLKERGFKQALIPAVGPVKFYERCCSARIVERLRGRIR